MHSCGTRPASNRYFREDQTAGSPRNIERRCDELETDCADNRTDPPTQHSSRREHAARKTFLAWQNSGIICQSAGWIYDHDLIAVRTVDHLRFFGIALSDLHNMLYSSLALDGENAPLLPTTE